MDQWLRRAYVSVRNTINSIRLLGLDGVQILIKSLFGSRDTAIVNIAGAPISVRHNTTDLATLLQIFWNREYEFELAISPDVIIDGGANVGYSSVYFAQRFPGAQIISVEPHPENFAQLQKNTQGFPQISAVQAAIWHRNEDLGLWDPDEGHWGFRVDTTNESESSQQLMIKGVSIDSLAQQFDFTRIDLLKLDIEGSEKEVFESSHNWIDNVDVIVAELHDKYRVGCARAFYVATQDFPHERRLGENIIVSRSPYIGAHQSRT